MEDYFANIYQAHRRYNPDKVPAPKNFWPYSFQFYMCNPIKVFSCSVINANTNPEINIEQYIEPDANRGMIESEKMPTEILKKPELILIAEQTKTNVKELQEMKFIDEEMRKKISLRDANPIKQSKSRYKRKQSNA